MNTKKQQGFAHILMGAIIVVVLAAVGGTGYYVWHKNHHKTQSTTSQTSSSSQSSNNTNSSSSTNQTSTITTYDECVKSPGSTQLQTYPAVCKTKDGQSFTQSTASSPKYLTITEWGVRAPYSGTDMLVYKITADAPNIATIISGNLAAQYNCSDSGAGQIERFTPSQHIYAGGGGPSASSAAAADPTSWGHVGNYYYMFVHDQGDCSDQTSTSVVQAQNNANNFTKSLVPKLEATP